MKSYLHRIKQSALYAGASFIAATCLILVNSYHSTAVASEPNKLTTEYAEPETQLELAKTYLTGELINNEKGLSLISEAARQGLPEAQFQLGLFFDPMIGTYFKNYITDASEALLESGELEHDGFRAKTLYQQAADQGYAQAMAALGIMYLDGTAVTEDIALAHRWFNEACDREDPLSCTLLEVIWSTTPP